jgi:N,N'-diacetyllegionaminate synthase
MSTLEEVGRALEALQSSGLNRSAITVLHCTSAYPAPFNELNLPAMLQIKDKFQVAVGYSDHSMGTVASLSAVTLGAEVIEKHLTLDRTMAGPDHQASIEPDELEEMVTGIRNIEKAMLCHEKVVTPTEMQNRKVVRKSIVAKTWIKKGDRFSEMNLGTKRPGEGLSPMKWEEVIGAEAKRNFEPDEIIEL